MTANPDTIAEVVLRQFDKLPQKRKPQIRDNGLHEWVPLSGIVAEQDGVLRCLSLAYEASEFLNAVVARETDTLQDGHEMPPGLQGAQSPRRRAA